MQNEDFPVREFDEDFVQECEQAILDRDEKIKVLLSELASKSPSPNQAVKNNDAAFSKIEKSLFSTRKKFGQLQKWFENFEERKVRRLESTNSELRKENTILQERQHSFAEKRVAKDQKTNSFLINLKKELKAMRNEMQDLKEKQQECGKIVNFYVEKTKEKAKEADSAKNQTMKRPCYSNNCGGYLTPDEKTKKLSENTVSTKSSQNQELKSEYHRKSTIIQCILKSLNQKNLEKLKNLKKNKVFHFGFSISKL